MALDLSDCQFQGPALAEPFVKLDLEKELQRVKLLPKTTGPEGRKLAEEWDVYRRKLRELVDGRSGRQQPGKPARQYGFADRARQLERRSDLEKLLAAICDRRLRLDRVVTAPTQRPRLAHVGFSP